MADVLIGMVGLILQAALKYSERYGVDKVRVLTLKENRGKGGAVRLVSIVSLLLLLLFTGHC